MYRRFGKRACDALGAVLLLAALAVPMGLVALLLLGVQGRPVLHRQPRAGLGGAPFMPLKFRTMREGAGDDAARLTRLGRCLRAIAVDELPQLVNVLRGEMSLVGPRPLPCDYIPRFAPRAALRLRVRPGLAGLAQAAGRNSVPWEERLELDARYAEAAPRLGTDLRILSRCVLLAVTARGAHAPGHATMPPLSASDSNCDDTGQ